MKRTLEITLFGRLIVRRGGVPLDLPTKVAELLCILLLRRGKPLTREVLATTLWGDASPAQGKKYLRQSLWQLQQALEGGGQGALSIMQLEREWVSLLPDSGLLVDAYQLDDACAPLDSCPDIADLARACAAAELYVGELLEGWYQEWCLIERERYRALFLSLLERLLESCIVQREIATGLTYGLRLLRLEPSRERSHRSLMRLYALSGDRGAALHQLERCRAVLEREFGVGPGATTLALADRIRAGELDGAPAEPVPDFADELAQLRACVERLQAEVARLNTVLATRD